MRPPGTIVWSLLFFASVITGCVSSEESGLERDTPVDQEQRSPGLQAAREPPSVPEKTKPRQAKITAREDTLVAAVTTKSKDPAGSRRTIKRPPNPAYTVQLAAFTKAPNALSYQKAVRKQFPGKTVHNVFDSAEKIYRVSIGTFASRKEAAALRREIMRAYPEEYREAWVNYIAR